MNLNDLFVALMLPFFRQLRKPTGFLGRVIIKGMNREHHKLTNWGLGYLDIENNYTILDIGCGGGRTISKLASIATSGKVYGIDYSDECVKFSIKHNRKLIESNRIEICKGTVSLLPYDRDSFDLVTAIESHYFWPDLKHDLLEILRALRPGGTFVIICGVYKNSKFDDRNEKIVDKLKMHYHSIDEIKEFFSKVGYQAIQVFENYVKGWICILGKKPDS